MNPIACIVTLALIGKSILTQPINASVFSTSSHKMDSVWMFAATVSSLILKVKHATMVILSMVMAAHLTAQFNQSIGVKMAAVQVLQNASTLDLQFA